MFEENIEKIKFETFKEFCERAEEILVNYEVVSLLPFFSIRKYKNYIYSKKIYGKDLIWEYLMGDITIDELREKEDK